MKEKVNKYKNIYNANIIDIFKFSPLVQDVLKQFKENSYSLYVNGVTPHVNYLLTYCSFVQNKDDFIFYVAENAYKAQLAYDAFCRLVGYENVNLYVVDEVAALETVAVSRELKQERLVTIKNILNNNKKIIVTHIAAFLKPILSLENIKKGVIKLKKGNEVDVNSFTKKLVKMGYKRVSTTYDIGEFSVRGEIIDIYPIYWHMLQ